MIDKALFWAANAVIYVVALSFSLWMRQGINAIIFGTLAAFCVWARRYERHRQPAGRVAMVMETNDQAVLCYITHPWAYFTTQPIQDQWGDDWDDAPYEDNAEPPYTAGPRAETTWSIIAVAFETAEYETPDTWGKSSGISVREINAGAVPWLRSARFSEKAHDPIMAGTTLREFVRRIVAVRGGIWLPLA